MGQEQTFEGIEAFLQKYPEIQPAARARARKCAVDAIIGGPIRYAGVPEDLRGEFRRAIVEEAYRHKCRQLQGKAKYYDPKQPVMPMCGREFKPSTILPVKWIL